MILLAIVRRWLHCLLGTFGKHRSFTFYHEDGSVTLACECGAIFYKSEK